MSRSGPALWACILALAAAVPGAASACAVSRPLSPEALAQNAAAEGQAWAEAPLVYLARVTAMGAHNEYFVLTPVAVLKGEGTPPVVNRPEEPFVGPCVFYHGLNLGNGGWIGGEFVIYAFDTPPTADSRMRIVSAGGVGDPATRRALAQAQGSR